MWLAVIGQSWGVRSEDRWDQCSRLSLIAEGCPAKEISKKLALTIKMMGTRRGESMYRLDIHDQGRLVRYEIRRNLVSMESWWMILGITLI